VKDPQPGELEAPTIAVLEARVPETARAMLDLSRREVPDYAAFREPGFAEAAYAHCLDHVRAFLTVARERRPLRPEELEFVRAQAAMRARQGVPLNALLHVYRMGHRAIFHAIVEAAGTTPQGTAAALVLTDRTLGHIDVITTTFTEAYLDTRHEIEAGADVARRALVDRALAGSVDPGPGGADRARALGFDPDVPYVVVTCSADGDREGRELELHALAGRLGRLDLRDGRPGVAVVREQEVVAVLRLADRTPQVMRGSVRDALGWDGHRAGISLACRGVGELARGYAEARAMLRQAGPGEIASLLEFTPIAYLTANADGTALRLVEPRVRDALEADARAGGGLADTLLAFLDADLSAPAAAEALFVHPNTVYYRLNKLARLTGRNPRRFHDLVDLMVAARLLGHRPAATMTPDDASAAVVTSTRRDGGATR